MPKYLSIRIHQKQVIDVMYYMIITGYGFLSLRVTVEGL